MNSKQFFSTIAFFCLIIKPGYAEVWTLDRTVSTALYVSGKLAVEKLEANIADLEAVSAEKSWFPKFSFSAGANYVSDVMEVNMPFKTIRFGDYDSYDFNLTFQQLLYDGGRLKAMKESGKNRSEMSLYSAEAVGLAIEFQAKAAFFNVIMAESSIEAAQQSLIEAKNHFNDVNARYDQGMALENDVLGAKLRISNAEMELVSRKADFERSKAAFRKVTGCAPEEDVIVKWEEKDLRRIETKRFKQAFELRPEFKAFDAAITASEKSVKAVRANLLPNVGLFGGFNYGKPGLDLPNNEWMHYFRGGVRLNWNVWDWGKTKREIDKAAINKKKIVKNRDDFELAVAQEISEAYAQYEEVKKRELLSIEAAGVAKRRLELTQSAYREGMATETDYDNSHASFTKTAYNTAISKVALWLSAAQIEYVLGIRYSGGSNE